MELHLRAKHNFPTPAMAPATEVSSNTICAMRPVTPPLDPAPSQSSTPCRDERPLIALFPDFQESSVFSEAQPTLQDLVDNPEGSEGGMTSVEVSGPEEVHMTSPVRQEELSAAIDSILSDHEPSAPETSDGQEQVRAPSPALATELGHPDHPPASPPVADNAPDLLAQATEAAQIEVNETPDFVALPLSSTGPADPRYFFFGAPSIEDPSPNARLINEARERAMRGWASDAYSVRFQPMNLFAIQKEESLRLPDGQVYTLRTYWIEQPQPLQ